MLTKLTIRNFKVFDEVEIELGERVVFVGPNNSGKTSALQALSLWHIGLRRWVEKNQFEVPPKERSGATINRRDLIAVPATSARSFWRDLHIREGRRESGRTKTSNIFIEIGVEGINEGSEWNSTLEFDYANEESFYCRTKLGPDENRLAAPPAAADVRLAYLPPMSGLASNETRLDEGAIGVRLGEGRTAEVLRNLCWRVYERADKESWNRLVERMRALFGVDLAAPKYVRERGEIALSFRTRNKVELEISASGRGQQQTLLLLAHMAANPGCVLLLDEPDAHLEFRRQRQIYNVLTETAKETNSQIIAASHSEVILNEAADRDMVIAFVGKNPHRIDDRGSQLLKSLKEIGFDQYLQAEEAGWVFYLEGSTDLAILRAFAKVLDHSAQIVLERPFFHYVFNQPPKAQDHFYGLREAKRDLVGVALYDRLEQALPADPNLIQLMWRKREIENYLSQRETLLAFAESAAPGTLWADQYRTAMEISMDEIASAFAVMGDPDPNSPDIKASDKYLDPLFANFYKRLKLPNLMRKTDYHTLAPFIPRELIDPEVIEKLDAIVAVASRAVGAEPV